MGESTILVTGAGGFIGDRLTHRLALQEPYDVRPLVHRISGAHAMRLARLPVDIEQGSILDRDLMATMLEDCDAVIHCAVGTEETIVEGTHTLFEEAEAAGVEHIIHLSSASVHGHEWDGELTEASPVTPDTPYGTWKVEAEQNIERFTQTASIKATIIRPFIVYGPFSEFVVDPVAMIRSGAILADGGIGTFNGIYVDNLIDALLLALNNEQAYGETFLLSDGDSLTWRSYFEALASSIADHPPIAYRTSSRIALERKITYGVNSIVPPFRALKRILGSAETKQVVFDEFDSVPWANALYSAAPDRLTDRLSGENNAGKISVHENGSSPRVEYALPEERYVKMQRSTGTISSAKATSILGWEPRISQAKALSHIQDWIAETEGNTIEADPSTPDPTLLASPPTDD